MTQNYKTTCSMSHHPYLLIQDYPRKTETRENDGIVYKV